MLMGIIVKELKRVFTDKRLIISTFVLPALSIYIIYSLMGSMLGGMLGDIESHRSSVFIGNAPPGFVDYYNNVKNHHNMEIHFVEYALEDYKEDIRSGNIDLFISFENDFDLKIEQYELYDRAPEIMTYYNPTEEYSAEARNKFVYDLLGGYQEEILVNRFGNINFIKAFDVDVTNGDSVIMDDRKAAGEGLGMMVPMLLAIILFAGAMGIGIDIIAGEKERGTMATLLLTPVPRETIALGKVIGLGIISIFSALCTFTAIILSLPKMMSSFDEGGLGGMSLSFNTLQYAQLFLVMIGLVGIYVGLICLISVRARSVKEAGTYMAPVYMIIMVASFSTMFMAGGEVALYKFAIPIYGSVLAIKELFAFELTLSEFGIAFFVSILVSAILVKLITITFNDEKVMFNA